MYLERLFLVSRTTLIRPYFVALFCFSFVPSILGTSVSISAHVLRTAAVATQEELSFHLSPRGIYMPSPFNSRLHVGAQNLTCEFSYSSDTRTHDIEPEDLPNPSTTVVQPGSCIPKVNMTTRHPPQHCLLHDEVLCRRVRRVADSIINTLENRFSIGLGVIYRAVLIAHS